VKKDPSQINTASILAIAALTVCLLAGKAHASVELTAQVDDLNPPFGGRVTYTATLTGGSLLPDITPPDFDGFEIVMGPSMSSSFEMVNGRMSQSKSITYVLRAVKSGHVTIGPAKAIRKRKTYAVSNSIELDVGQSTAPAVPETDEEQSEAESRVSFSDLFITAKANKDTVYKQEMVIVTYRIYMRVTVNGYEITKLPQARGFWTEDYDLPPRPNLRDTVIGGKSYKTAVLRKTALFPTRTGKLTIEPLEMDCQVQLPARRRYRRSRDPFQMFFQDPFMQRSETRSIRTRALTLVVRDLPAANCPASFKGDVGDFRLRVNYDKRQITQHDALTVKVVVSGSGYLKSIDPPRLKLPTGFEQFDPTVKESISLIGNSMKGKMTFTYLVIPRRVGTFDLSPVVFSYFDPQTGRYNELSDGGIRLTVEAAEGPAAFGTWSERSDVALLNSDIRFIKELNGPLVATTEPVYSSIWFYVTLGLSPLLFILGLGTEAIVIRRGSDPAALRRRKAPEKMRRELNRARKTARRGNLYAAIDIAARALIDMAGAVTFTPAAGLTTDSLVEFMSHTDVDPGLVDEVVSLIHETDRIRFSGGDLSQDAVDDLLKRFKHAAEGLEKLK